MSDQFECEIDLSLGEQVLALSSTVDGVLALSSGGLLELVFACLEPSQGRLTVVEGIDLLEPIIPANGYAIIFDCEMSGRFSIRGANVSAANAVLHASGATRDDDCVSSPRSTHELASGRRVLRDDFYSSLDEAGLVTGAALRLCDGLDVDTASGVVTLWLRDAGPIGNTGIPASVLDTALQLVTYLGATDPSGRSRVSRIGRIRQATSERKPVSIRAEPSSHPPSRAVWNAYVLDASGALVAELLDIRLETPVEHDARRLSRWTQAIIAIITETLSLPGIGAEDDMIAAGASSMDLVRLSSALNEVHGWAPSIEQLFEGPSPRSIAMFYARGSLDGALSRPRKTVGQLEERNEQLARAEQRLWYLERFADVSPAYNEAAAWTLQGEIDVEALRESVAVVVSRHDNLRAVFPERDGQPYRDVRAHAEIEFKIMEVAAGTGDGDVSALLEEEARRPFAADTPMFRALLVRVAPARHALLLVAHHMVCDAWSVASLVQVEIQAAYAGLTSQRRIPGMAEAPQAARYAAWEAKHLDMHLGDLVAWWVAELGDAPTVLQLPADHVRPARLTHRGARLAYRLDPALRAELTAFARSHAVSPFAVLFAAYRLLVFRYTGVEKALIAVPASLRAAAATEGIVGCLVNTIPIRVDVDPQMSLLSVVNAVKQTLGRALTRAEVPFEALATAMRCERGSSHSPLVQVGFSYQDVLGSPLQLRGLSVTEIAVHTRTSKFELMLEVRLRGNDLAIEFEYSTDLFGESRVAQMAGHFMTALRRVIEHPDSSVGDDWLLSTAEREQLLRLGTGPCQELDDNALSRSLAARLVDSNHSVALIGELGEMTYAQIGRNVEALIAQLAPLDPGRNRIVGLCTGRTTDWAIGVMALVRLGWGYLPIDPETPAPRAQTSLEKCGVGLLLYTSGMCTWSHEFGGRAVAIGSGLELRTGFESPWRAVDGADVLYAISTSGSTGEPKLTAVTYRGFGNLVEWYRRALALEESSRVLVVTSVAFDIAQKNLFAALGVGACVVLYTEQVFDPAVLAHVIERSQATVINLTPSIMNSLLDACGRTNYRALASLRHVVLGGEPVDARALSQWLEGEHGRDATIWNTYGPTECSDVVSFWSGRPSSGTRVPIGKPLPNVGLHVVDERGYAVPVGVSGELCISGLAVGKGYIGDQSATDIAFASLPTGTFVYWTGDRARYEADGALHCEGRNDQQVKVRGYRIELEEIESVIRRHPDVIEVAAQVRQLGDRTTAIHACFTAASDVCEKEVLRFVRGILPRHMVPSLLRRVPAIPKTQSGKVDRLALVFPTVGHSARSEWVEGELERELLKIWQEALENSDVGVSDDFFDVGGHSLLAVKLAQRISEACSCSCSVKDLIDNPTVEQVAQLLHARAVAPSPR